ILTNSATIAPFSHLVALGGSRYIGSLLLSQPGRPLHPITGVRRLARFVCRHAMNTATVRSYMAKPGQVEQKWWLVDANEKTVGRLASDIAVVLMGKHRPTYTPHVDTGDYVVVINVEKIHYSGKKWDQKQYTWTTGYPGLKTESARTRFER